MHSINSLVNSFRGMYFLTDNTFSFSNEAKESLEIRCRKALLLSFIADCSVNLLGLEDVCINDLLLETIEETMDLILGLTDCCGTTMKRLEVIVVVVVLL